MKTEHHGGDMTIRKIVIFAAAVALSGCASVAPQPSGQAMVQPALYVASDATSAIASPGSGGAKGDMLSADTTNSAMAPGESKQVRIYWFLGGR